MSNSLDHFHSSAVGVISGAGSYADGTTATLSAYAKKGYVFRYWLKDGAEFDGNGTNQISVTVNDDSTYTAVFGEAGAKVNGVAVNVSCGQDATACGVVGMRICVRDGTTYLVVHAYALTGYAFIGWAIDGDLSTTYTTDTVFIPYAEALGKLVTAQFAKMNLDNENFDLNN